ncbi:sulfatase [Halosquirtibacter xylanolyticus]|uniref:sulfatase n=1 Tax=Halosquirtibacter xylanolyticus TaxID=3374599 RepID=UPI003748B56B|nr:sulfatase [Prolixibacteraceae bacterium]
MKRTFSLFCLATTIFASCITKTKDAKKPNVLMIYMDDLRPELACYGLPNIKSPNIDLLANEGIQFTNAYCNVAICGASRASMLTGLYPTKDHFISYDVYVKEEKPQITSMIKSFKNSGYTTVSNGKIFHHMDDNPNDWDEIWRPHAFEKNDKGLTPVEYWESLWRDYQLPENKLTYAKNNNGPAFECADVPDSTYIDGLLVEKVIRDMHRLKETNKPFLLTAGFNSNHLPFNAPKKYWDMYDEKDVKLPYNNFVPKNAPQISIGNWGELRGYMGMPKKGAVDSANAVKLIHGYYATVSYVDALIGKLIGALKREGLDENTIVVLVSDHGYNLMEHTLWAKYKNYKTSMQVPFIISVPGYSTGVKNDELVELVDVYPTMVELCGLKAPSHQLEGKSIVPLLKDPKTKGKEFVFTKNATGFSIRSRDYCYTEYINLKTFQTKASMLYDLSVDPDENENVVDYPKYATVVAEMKTILHENFNKQINGL